MGDALTFARLLVRGRFARRVRAHRGALLVEVDTLLRAARALPSATLEADDCRRRWAAV